MIKVSPKDRIPPHNLPTPLSTFVGREGEIAEVMRLLASNRLITLMGAGGSGKTRLSFEIARELLPEFEHGIWLVELASLFNPALIPQTIASTLNLREQSGQSLMDVLVDHLSTQDLLLILDNCEHLISASARVAEALLQSCPGLKILATSREVLGITGEVAWAVPPLSLPAQQPWANPVSARDAMRFYEASESVQLFVARAETIAPDFKLSVENGPWVAEICRRLDGLPLAIELAAARVRTLSVPEIAQRLDDRFELLTSGSRTAPPRQQTLAATLDWSYALLSSAEQSVLQCLSIFVGGATLDAAQFVCQSQGVRVFEALARLVDKSLVTVVRPGRGETRYRLLETIRQYALDKLAKSGRLEEFKNRHLDYFLQWAEAAEPDWKGAQQLFRLEAYESEHDNLRAALEWCHTDLHRAEDGLRLVIACAFFWRSRGYLSEGRAYLTDALARADAHQKTETYARALFWSASLAYLQSDYPATRWLGERILAIWQELDSADKSVLADIFDLLGELATEQGDYGNAPRLLKEALAIYRELDDPHGVGDMLMQLGWAYMRMGEYEQADPLMEEARGIFQEIEDVSHLGFALSGLGELAIRQGQHERAQDLLEASLVIRKRHGHKWGMAASLGSLGWVALQQHDFTRMKSILEESLAIRMEVGDKGGIAWCLEKLGEAKYIQSQFQEAAQIFGHAQASRAPIGSVIDPADQAEYHRMLSGLRAALGEEAFAALWAEGAAMTLEEIMQQALSDPVSGSKSSGVEKEKFGGLTAREREAAAWIARGKSNREIAEAMAVSVKTVETYVTRILNKLGFDSRVQVATWAVEKGLR